MVLLLLSSESQGLLYSSPCPAARGLGLHRKVNGTEPELLTRNGQNDAPWHMTAGGRWQQGMHGVMCLSSLTPQAPFQHSPGSARPQTPLSLTPCWDWWHSWWTLGTAPGPASTLAPLCNSVWHITGELQGTDLSLPDLIFLPYNAQAHRACSGQILLNEEFDLCSY